MRKTAYRPSNDGTGRTPRMALQRELSKRTRAEHDDLLVAMHHLEAALASPAPGREEGWANRVASALPRVCELLRTHVESAEEGDGLCAELLSARPELGYRIEQLRTEHARLLDQAAALGSVVQKGAESAGFADVRQEAASLLAAIRRHHANEVDLIYECFCTDIGVGD